MAVRCIYGLAFLLAFGADGIALDGPNQVKLSETSETSETIEHAAKDLKKASMALNKELAEKPLKAPAFPGAKGGAKLLPLGVRQCDKYPDACKAEDLAAAKLAKDMKEHPERYGGITVGDTKYNVKVIKSETTSEKINSEVIASKAMKKAGVAAKLMDDKKTDKTVKVQELKELVKKAVVEVKAEPEKKAVVEVTKAVVEVVKAETKAKKGKTGTDTWFDNKVLGVKLPKLKLPFKLPWELALEAAAEIKASKNAKTATKTKTQFLQVSKGVERTVLKAGDGINFPKQGDTVTMHYTGTLTDGGKKFDSSVDRGTPFITQIGVGQVIKGWDEGVVKMSLGEKAVLKMTSDYGYGSGGAGDDIPPNAGLTFEVELLKIN